MWSSLTLMNAAFLGGLLALAIPVVIHLLIRRHFKKIPFSTLRFFLDRDPKLRHRSPSNLFLLFLRLVIFTLLILAFARPFLPVPGEARTEEERPRQIVLIVDTTASMGMKIGSGQRWDQARALAQNALRGLSPQDMAALILVGDPPRTKAPMGAPEKIARVLETLEPTGTSGELSDALDLAVKVLSSGQSSAQKEIRIISDLQSSTIGAWQTKQAPSSIDIKIMGLAHSTRANASVTGIGWTGARRLEADVLIKNESDTEVLPARKIQLFVDGIPRAVQTIDLPAAGFEHVRFTLPELSPGLHAVEVRMDNEDGFAADNIYRQVIAMPEIRKVLVVEPELSETVWKQKSYFLSRALMSSPDGSPESARFRIETFPLAGLGIKLRMEKYDLIIIPAIEDWPTDSAGELNAHVQRGGAMIVFAGPGMDVNQYHGAAPWLPVKLRKQEMDQDHPKHIGVYDRDFPAFSLFEKPHSGDIGMAEFTGRYILDPIQDSRVLAAYDDGVPFLVERIEGKSRIYFVNASADASWSNWPKLKTFLPWLHSLTDVALGSGGNPADMILKPLQAAEKADIPIPAGVESMVQIIDPDGQVQELSGANGSAWSGVNLMVTGFYTMKNKEGQVRGLIAVNSPRAESDMRVANAALLMDELKRVPEPPARLLSSPSVASEPSRRELWTWILLAALCLVIVEPLIANRI